MSQPKPKTKPTVKTNSGKVIEFPSGIPRQFRGLNIPELLARYASKPEKEPPPFKLRSTMIHVNAYLVGDYWRRRPDTSR